MRFARVDLAVASVTAATLASGVPAAAPDSGRVILLRVGARGECIDSSMRGEVYTRFQ
jgi:hypothetical protein